MTKNSETFISVGDRFEFVRDYMTASVGEVVRVSKIGAWVGSRDASVEFEAVPGSGREYRFPLDPRVVLSLLKPMPKKAYRTTDGCSRHEKVEKALRSLQFATRGNWWVAERGELLSDPIGSVKIAARVDGGNLMERAANADILSAARDLAEAVLELREKLAEARAQ